MVTHQYLEALLFGQMIIVLDSGSIIQQGGQRDLLEHPRSSYVAELVGMNFFQGHISHYEANGVCAIQLHNGAQPVEVLATLKERTAPDKIPQIGEEAYIIVDPSSITLYHKPPEASARNIFRGEIIQILRLGTSIKDDAIEEGRLRVSMMLDNATPPLTAEITEASAQRMGISEGKTIYAAFKATEARAYT
jgi:molybdopterin-binding protein